MCVLRFFSDITFVFYIAIATVYVLCVLCCVGLMLAVDKSFIKRI